MTGARPSGIFERFFLKRTCDLSEAYPEPSGGKESGSGKGGFFVLQQPSLPPGSFASEKVSCLRT